MAGSKHHGARIKHKEEMVGKRRDWITDAIQNGDGNPAITIKVVPTIVKAKMERKRTGDHQGRPYKREEWVILEPPLQRDPQGAARPRV